MKHVVFISLYILLLNFNTAIFYFCEASKVLSISQPKFIPFSLNETAAHGLSTLLNFHLECDRFCAITFV